MKNPEQVPHPELTVIVDPTFQFRAEPVGYLFYRAGTVAVYFHSCDLFRDFPLRWCAYCQIKVVVDFPTFQVFGRAGLKTKT